MEAKRQEADVQFSRHGPNLVVMRFQFRIGLVEGFHRCARKLELPRGFQRDCRIPLFQADHVAAVLDRLAAERVNPFQQAADRSGLAVGRLIWRCLQVSQAETELLMLGTEAELLRRLAASRKIIRQLFERRDRCRVGISGIGHVAPGKRV